MPTSYPVLSSVRAVQDFIDGDLNLKGLLSDVERLLASDPAHDLAHFFRVTSWTSRIGEGALKPSLAVAAGFLHDIVNVPKNSPDRARASEFSAAKALEILPGRGFSQTECVEVVDAIRCHSFSRGEDPTTLLGRALQDADRLESLGALGVMRVFSTGGTMKTQYFHTTDPWAEGRTLEDLKFSVDHFFTKLFKLPAMMKTPIGRAEAARRVEFMVEFLRRLGEEIEIPNRLFGKGARP